MLLTRYIRDSHRKPIGVVMSTGLNEVGYSLCNKKDAWDKEKGKMIAFRRATGGFNHPIPDSIYIDYYSMVDRSDRYFGYGY